MKNIEIKRLDWDSNFFGFEVGEIDGVSNFSDVEKFDLIVVKQTHNEPVKIQNFKNTFQETKVIFNKHLTSNYSFAEDSFIIDYDDQPIDKKLLYSLAFESGKYSRFKLDIHLEDKFKLIYSKWVDNSLNKEFADKVFYFKILNEVVGFVTVKDNKEYSTIGLIAVSENHQGKGIGKKMLLKIEEYCMSNNIFELRIPTQKENLPACRFYNKMGYKVIQETILKHYWKNIKY